MAKEDFAAGFLQGLYNAGVGNPDVRRQKEQQNIETAFKQQQMDAQMAAEGMVRPQQQDQMHSKIGDFVKNLFGVNQPKTLQTAYQPDPNAQFGYLGADNQLSDTETPGSIKVSPNQRREIQIARAKQQPSSSPEESFTLAGTDAQGNFIQVGNKSGKVRSLKTPSGGPIYPKTETPLTPESAGRLNMLSEAVTNMKAIESQIFSKDGKLNRSLMLKANFPWGGLPFTEGRNIDSIMDDAINAKLRAETGAAATPSEIANVSKRFRISVRDSDTTAKSKYDRFVDWLGGARDLADPRGFKRKGAGQKNMDLGTNDPLGLR